MVKKRQLSLVHKLKLPPRKKRVVKKSSTTKPILQKPFIIVGIGASAGGLEALSQLFADLTSDTGLAFVVIQHLAPTHESFSAEILSRKTKMRVEEIKDGIKVQANHVYIIPPNHNLTILHGVLNLMPRVETRGYQMAVDFFFQSLAEDQKHNAIGIILSGTAADGTKGLQAIKTEGGLTIVQDPTSAKYDGMPRSAINAGVVDLILSPAQIAAELINVARHTPLARHETSALPFKNVDAITEDSLRKIFSLIRNQSHVDFTHYKYTTLKRRIARRIALHKNESLENYLEYLQLNPHEVQALFNDFLINVTEFFRDPDVFVGLKKQIFPKILMNKSPNSTIRIWVIGCATGEEAYSVAITLLEVLGETFYKTKIQIFATDISESAIQKARTGFFPEDIHKNVSTERLQRFFIKTENGYKIRKSVRDLCIFSRHDVTSDPPFAKLDLICCRNLLMYFDSILQKRMLPIWHYALNTGGFLCLGRSETVGNLATLFRVINKTKKLYSRNTAPSQARWQFGVPSTRYTPEKLNSTTMKPLPEKDKALDLQHETEQLLLAEYAPPSVVINSDTEIILVAGNVAPYLKLSPGQASLNFFKMIRSELVPDLRMMLQTIKKQNIPIKKENIHIQDDDQNIHLMIRIIPLYTELKSNDRRFLIIFEQTINPVEQPKFEGLAQNIKGPSKKIIKLRDRQIKDLNKQLAEARSYQQSLIEDYEATQEEATSANEELQSTNEEFQSTNEELETAKEELQSANEELITLNDELQNSNNDLTKLNNDLMNLLATGNFPIIMLSADGQIRRFTSLAGKLLNLVPSDVGRLIGSIKPNFKGPDLQDLVTDVMEKVTVEEFEIESQEGRYFQVQVRPYTTMDNKIDGAVISFVDITALKQNLTKSQAALSYASSVSDTLSLPLVVIDEQLCIMSANKAFSRIFWPITQKNIGTNILSVFDRNGWKFPHLHQLLTQVLTEDRSLKNFEIEHNLSNVGHQILLLNAERIKWQEDMPKAILLSIDDITERRLLELELQQYQERFRIMVEDIKNYAIFMLDPQGKIVSWSKGAERIEGYHAKEIIGKHFSQFYTKEDIQSGKPERLLQTVVKTGHVEDEGYRVRKDGTQFWAEISITPILDKNKHLLGFSKVVYDATERRNLLDRERLARLEAENANKAKDTFLATLSHELRTPLNAISGWSQLLKTKTMDPKILEHGLDVIEWSAYAQNQLIQDLLDISRIQSGKLSLTMSKTNFVNILGNAINSVQLLAKEKNIRIEIIESIKTGTVSADATRLQQVFWNLLTNSIKFSPKNSKIEIYISKIKEKKSWYVAARIVDHGKGIDPTFLPRIFTRFSQEDSSSVRVHGGLGIGLSLSYDLVKSHDGNIQVESPGPGQGSTFTVLLPLVNEKKPTATHKPKTLKIIKKTQPNLAKLKILLLDDESNSLETLSEVVKSFGGEPIQCTSVKKAMIACKKFQPDIVVSDIAMPLEDGYSFIRKLRALPSKQGGQVPAMAVTAYASKSDIARAIAAGFQQHMAKPINNEKFGRMIIKLIKKVRRKTKKNK